MARYTEKDVAKIDAIIRCEYDNKTAHTVAFLGGYKFSASFVKARARQLGYEPYKMKVEWTQQDMTYIMKHYAKSSLASLANHFDVHVDMINELLKKLGLYSVKPNRKKNDLRRALGGCADDYDDLMGSLWSFDGSCVQRCY